MRVAQSHDNRNIPYTAVKMLADEVVDQLASMFRPQNGEPVRPVEVDVATFTHTLLHETQDKAIEIIRQERTDGVPTEVIYLHTLAGAARLMGEMWDEDRISFLDMTIATGRIFAIMRDMRLEMRQKPFEPLPKHRALFVTVPGETHVLGVTMAADLMRERGWQIALRTGLTHQDLIDGMADERHEMIGISAGQPCAIPALTRLVVALRIMQPWAYIFVGGNLAHQIDDLKDLIGVDAVMSGEESIEATMEAMITLPPRDLA